MFEAQFQSFDDRTDRAACAPRLAALREELTRRGLGGFVVPRADRYLNEYVPPSDERLAWLTGFTGSSGIAVVLTDSAALFVDGRYQVQVREEVDSALFSIEHLVEQPPHAWIKDNLPAGAQLGFSPWLHTVDGAERLAKACADAGGNSSRSKKIRSISSGPTGPSRRLVPSCCTICAMPAKMPRARSRGCAARCSTRARIR